MGGMGGNVGGMGGEGGAPGQTCFDESECPTGQYCDIEDGAFSGTCRDGCNDAADCADGEACDVENHECVPEPCTGDADCPEGRCGADGQCVDSECSSERACELTDDGRSQECDVETGECRPLFACCSAAGECSTAVDGACPDGADQLMDALSCEPNPCGERCENDTQCGEGQYCNLTDNRCQDGCRDEAGACPEGQSCDPETRECVQRPCVESDDCGSYQFCDDEIGNICTDGCRSNDDCVGDGEICDGGDCIVRCVPDDPSTCGPDEYCNQVTQTCEDNCDEHEDCEENEACNPVNNQCEQSECRDDIGEGAEPNNDVENAVAIELGEPDANGVQRGVIEGRFLCGDDVDFFSVTLPQARRMRVRLIAVDDNDDLNMRLTGGDIEGNLEANTAENPEELIYPEVNVILNETTYYIEVYPGRARDAGVEYRVEITAVPAEGGCFPDIFEDADDEPETATAIGNIPQFDSNEHNICFQGDQDWYTLPLQFNSGLRVEVIADGNQPPMSIALFSQGRIDGVGGGGPEYEDVIAEDRAGRVAYVLEIEADTGAFVDGDWYIRVRSTDPTAVPAYTISVSRLGGDECVDDSLEHNDDVAGGTDLAAIDGVGENGEVPYSEEGIEVPSPDAEPLKICSFDDDYYCLDLEAGDRLEAWAQGDTLGEVRVRLVDADGRAVGADGLVVSEQANPIPAELLGALEGRYCIIVDGQGAARADYRLWVRREAVANLCAQDPENGARNDIADRSTPLVDIEPDEAPNRRFEYRNALICGNESDWYHFEVLERRSRVCVMVDGFQHAVADIDIELYRPGAGEGCRNDAACDPGTFCIEGVCRAAIEESVSNTSAEQIAISKRLIGNNNGEYKLRVFREGDGDAAYNVLATVTPEDEVCGPDWQERAAGANDNAAQAIALGAGLASFCDTWLCGDEDEDFYSIVVPAGQDRTIFIEYANQDDGRIFMDIVDAAEANGMPPFAGFRRSADPQGDHQCINLRGGAEDQTVTLRIFSNLVLDDGDDRVDYALQVVPTDLSGLDAANPASLSNQGECVNLGASDLGTCSFADPFADGCWPFMELE